MVGLGHQAQGEQGAALHAGYAGEIQGLAVEHQGGSVAGVGGDGHGGLLRRQGGDGQGAGQGQRQGKGTDFLHFHSPSVLG